MVLLERVLCDAVNATEHFYVAGHYLNTTEASRVDSRFSWYKLTMVSKTHSVHIIMVLWT